MASVSVLRPEALAFTPRCVRPEVPAFVPAGILTAPASCLVRSSRRVACPGRWKCSSPEAPANEAIESLAGGVVNEIVKVLLLARQFEEFGDRCGQEEAAGNNVLSPSKTNGSAALAPCSPEEVGKIEPPSLAPTPSVNSSMFTYPTATAAKSMLELALEKPTCGADDNVGEA